MKGVITQNVLGQLPGKVQGIVLHTNQQVEVIKIAANMVLVKDSKGERHWVNENSITHE